MDNKNVEFAHFAGDLVESVGFNRSIGQIYGYLYLNQKPGSLTEIAEKLSMSKGNASLNLRTLESWGAVFPVSVQGSRRDHYQANMNYKEVILRRVQEGMEKRLAMAEDKLSRLLGGSDGKQSNPEFAEKMEEFQALIKKSRSGLKLLPRLVGFLG